MPIQDIQIQGNLLSGVRLAVLNKYPNIKNNAPKVECVPNGKIITLTIPEADVEEILFEWSSADMLFKPCGIFVSDKEAIELAGELTSLYIYEASKQPGIGSYSEAEWSSKILNEGFENKVNNKWPIKN